MERNLNVGLEDIASHKGYKVETTPFQRRLITKFLYKIAGKNKKGRRKFKNRTPFCLQVFITKNYFASEDKALSVFNSKEAESPETVTETDFHSSDEVPFLRDKVPGVTCP